MEKVWLKADSLNIYGEMFHPARATDSYPTVILCHGIPAAAFNPDDQGYSNLAGRLCDQGFPAFFLHFRGTRKSEGNFDILGWAHDLKAAIDYLCSRDSCRENGVVLVASSGGAAAGIYVAANDTRVHAVASLACPATMQLITANPQPVLEHFRKIGIVRNEGFPGSLDEWLNGFEEITPLQWVSHLAPRPLLLVHGDKDETVPLDHARQLLEKAGEPKELVIIPGASHRLRVEEKAIVAVLGWLKAAYR